MYKLAITIKTPPIITDVLGISLKKIKAIIPRKIKDVYLKGDVTATSAYLAALDIKKWPKEPIIPKLIAQIKLNVSGIIKLLGKKIIDVNNKEIE